MWTYEYFIQILEQKLLEEKLRHDQKRTSRLIGEIP
jgi:hypothetical protein